MTGPELLPNSAYPIAEDWPYIGVIAAVAFSCCYMFVRYMLRYWQKPVDSVYIDYDDRP